ncbi:hypothetical protein GCM10010975_19490 [Comamonas phosphati]|nr:hypothetical protein GCM10010975_19490 [Comamonas phosphati]
MSHTSQSAAAVRAARSAHPEDGKPWWKFPHVWLVVGGPAVVVVAGFVTAYIAWSAPDPVIDPDYYRHGVEINKRLSEAQKSQAPALTGRNHALTPAEDHPTDR